MTGELESRIGHWLLTEAPNALLALDATGRIVWGNPAAQTLFGYSAEAFQGLTVEALMPERYRASHQALRDAFMREPSKRRMNAGRALAARRQDGTEFIAEIGLNPIGDGLVLAAIQDVTERTRAEDALRESEERLRLFVEHAPVALAMFDRDMRYLVVSRRWLEDYSLGDARIVGRSHYDVFPEVPERWWVVHRRGMAGEIMTADEDRFDRGDGAVQWLRWDVRPWHAAGGAVGGIVIFTEDITARKQSEIALQAMQSEMEQLTRFQVASQTVSALAHELNQPLNAVTSYAEAALRLLRSGNVQPDRLQHAVESSAQQAQRAGKVVRELLAYLRRGEVQTEPVDLNDLVRVVLDRIDADGMGGFQTWLELAPRLPPVRANRIQVEKVLINLINNGVEAMHTSGMDLRGITVAIGTNADGSMARVNVRDTGPGIDASNLHRIFDPFFTTKPRGLGMGLAISRAIIESHGGQLWVDSEPGTGASFHFTLPFV